MLLLSEQGVRVLQPPLGGTMTVQAVDWRVTAVCSLLQGSNSGNKPYIVHKVYNATGDQW